MPFPIYIELREEQPADVSIRAWREALKRGNEEAAGFWREALLPRHFKPDAKGRYGHKPRTGRYLRRKMQLAKLGKVLEGGIVDLLATGLLKEFLTTTGVIRAYPSRFTVQMAGPRYIAMRPFKSNQPDKAAEVLKVLPEEAQELARLQESVIRDEIKRWRETKTTKLS